MHDATRRGFLGRFGRAAGAAAVTGGAAITNPAQGDEPPRGRRVIPGSPSPNYSRAVAIGEVVFVAGCLGTKPGTREIPADFADEVRQCLENLKAGVEASGSKLANVLKCTCFITEQSQFETFNQVYRTFFTAEPPARSTVVVKELVLRGARVEVDCVTFA